MHWNWIIKAWKRGKNIEFNHRFCWLIYTLLRIFLSIYINPQYCVKMSIKLFDNSTKYFAFNYTLITRFCLFSIRNYFLWCRKIICMAKLFNNDLMLEMTACKLSFLFMSEILAGNLNWQKNIGGHQLSVNILDQKYFRLGGNTTLQQCSEVH